MDIKVDLQQWNQACQAFDNQNYVDALKTLLRCRPSSKTYFNAGMILITRHDYKHAVEMFTKAIEHDQYFSAAYFQLGVANVMMDKLEKAVTCFDSAYDNLRGNKMINYQQLGLDFILYACEILYNRAICRLDLGNHQGGMDDLNTARQLKMNHQHDIINRVIKNSDNFPFGVFSIPPGVIYRLTKCQQQLLDGVDALSALYQCNRQAAIAAAQDILQVDQQQCDGGNSNKLEILRNHHLPTRWAKYLPATITREKTGRIRTLSPITTITNTSIMPHTLYPIPPPSTSPAPSSSFKPRQMQPQLGAHCGNRAGSPNNDNLIQDGKGTSGMDNAYNTGETLKLKLHYKDTHDLVVHAHSTFQEVLVKSQEKLNISPTKKNGLKLFCKGDDNQWVQLVDDKGWSFAKINNKEIVAASSPVNRPSSPSQDNHLAPPEPGTCSKS
ncbi:hypothetical protein BC941DRAFT_469048 [Chlamydoabsidia padenii]|nr:hypothetical protein BC941DRAFT_469048 [Chlamydoabsidia padenii]